MSSELHERVRRFIEASVTGFEPPESFDALGLEIAAFQAEHQPGYARLCRARGVIPKAASSVSELPAVPTDAFRMMRVASHPKECDTFTFRTSGTTMGTRGEHFMSTTLTYEAAALAWGRWALFPDLSSSQKLSTIILAPPPEEAKDSSLGFMMALFAKSFGRDPVWIMQGGELDIEKLIEACERASKANSPAIVMGASFAFVHALDALGNRRLPLPDGSRAMQTGGFKGKSREVEASELRSAIANSFALPEAAIVSEYGMTELSSQAYEGTLRAHLGLSTKVSGPGIFLPPPWMRIVPVDESNLCQVKEGEVGLLRFEDLANVDSALVIQTADRGRIVDGGVELLGRSPNAVPRGCSIAIDEILAADEG